MDANQYATTLRGASGWLRRDDDEDAARLFGTVATPYGLVSIDICTWKRGKDAGRQSVHFDAVVNGRRHTRWEDRAMSERLTSTGAKIVAHRWIRQLATDDSK